MHYLKKKVTGGDKSTKRKNKNKEAQRQREGRRDREKKRVKRGGARERV